MLKKLFGVGAIYALSVLSLFIGETLLIRESSGEDYGAFRLALNAGPLVALVAMLGNESATARLVAEKQSAIRWSTMQSQRALAGLILGFGFGLYGWFVLALDFWWMLGVAILSALLVSTNFFSAVQRSVDLPNRAAWSQQGYRLFGGVLIAVLAVLGVVDRWALFCLILGAGIFAISGFRWNSKLRSHSLPTDEERKWLASVGPGFALSGITMAALDFMDQLIVAQIASIGAAGEYSAIKLYVVFPVISIASILAFVALPMAVRFVATASWMSIVKVLANGLGASFIAAAVLGGAGVYALKLLAGISPPFGLTVCFLAVGMLRLYYTVPISLLSAMTSSVEIRWLGYIGIVGVGILLASPLLTFVFRDVDVVQAVAIGLVAAFSLRVVFAIYLCRRAFRRKSSG